MKKNFLFALVALAFTLLSSTGFAQNHIRIEVANYAPYTYSAPPPHNWASGTQYLGDLTVVAYDASNNPISLPSGISLIQSYDDILLSTLPDYSTGTPSTGSYTLPYSGTIYYELFRDEHVGFGSSPNPVYDLYRNTYTIDPASLPSGWVIDDTIGLP